MPTNVAKAVAAPVLSLPPGSKLELTYSVTGYDLTGKTVYFALASGSSVFRADSTGSAVTVAADSITIDLEPTDASSDDATLLLSALQSGYVRYAIDIEDPVEARVQGDIYYLPERGSFDEATASAVDYTLDLTELSLPTLTVSVAGVTSTAWGDITGKPTFGTASALDATQGTVGHFVRWADGAIDDGGPMGTAAFRDVGTDESNLVEVQHGGALPALDGSNLTGLTPSPWTGTTGGASLTKDHASSDLTTLLVNTTNPGSGSMLADFQVGGSSKFNIDDVGYLHVVNTLGRIYTHGANYIGLYDNGITLQQNATGYPINLNASDGYTSLNNGGQVRLYAKTANVLEQYNGTSAQEFRLYGTYTDASNYERGFMRFDGSGNLEIGHEAAGTGTARNVYLQSGNTTGHVVIGGGGQSRQQIRGAYSGANYLDLNAVTVTLAAGANGWPLYFQSKGHIWMRPDGGSVVVRNAIGTSTSGYATGGTLHVDGTIEFTEQSSDPSDPSAGRTIMWQSDGTGSGDDGDIMLKITDSGGTTKTITLVDYSAA